jgi:gamma-glutamyltranspeptidase/glutathione hydrolase
VNSRGYAVYKLPPNRQGLAALQMLTILEGFDLATWVYNSPDALHTLIEAKPLAFADRAKSYAAERRKLIGARAAKPHDSGPPALRAGDTIDLCTADSAGHRVSLIQSNDRGMGSGIVPPDLGFAFQDRGERCTLEPGQANIHAPGKRPFQTIIPGFVLEDGRPREAFGLMGGGMPPPSPVQVLVNQIDFGMNLREAGDAAHGQHEGSSEPTGEKMRDGGPVQVENGAPDEA